MAASLQEVRDFVGRSRDPQRLAHVALAHEPEEGQHDADVTIDAYDGPVGAYMNLRVHDTRGVSMDVEDLDVLIEDLTRVRKVMADSDQEFKGRVSMRVLETGTLVPLHRPAA